MWVRIYIYFMYIGGFSVNGVFFSDTYRILFREFFFDSPQETSVSNLHLPKYLLSYTGRWHLPVDRRPTETESTTSVDKRWPLVASQPPPLNRQWPPRTGRPLRYSTVHQVTMQLSPWSVYGNPRLASSCSRCPTSRPSLLSLSFPSSLVSGRRLDDDCGRRGRERRPLPVPSTRRRIVSIVDDGGRLKSRPISDHKYNTPGGSSRYLKKSRKKYLLYRYFTGYNKLY